MTCLVQVKTVVDSGTSHYVERSDRLSVRNAVGSSDNREVQMPLLMLLFLALSISQAAAFDFKGIEVGGPKTYTVAEVQSVLNGSSCNVEQPRYGSFKNITVCKGQTTVAEVPVSAAIEIHPSGVVISVELVWPMGPGYDKIEAAAITKYGRPKRSERAYKSLTMNHRWEDQEGNHITLQLDTFSDNERLVFGIGQKTRWRLEQVNTDDI
jgi:hypothetical protein